jgi:RNA polymerase sigma-70 factor, ECF subfamily
MDAQAEIDIEVAFLSRWSPSAARGREGELRPVLESAVEAAARDWPEVRIPAGDFASYLAERADVSLPPLQALANLCLSDLYLACGCVRGDRQAIARFDSDYLARLRPLLTRINPAPAFTDEVLQELRVGLLLPDSSSRPEAEAKIAQYRGRGSLRGWLKVSARRLAMALARDLEPYAELDSAVALAGAPELEYMRFRYTDVFRQEVRRGVSEALTKLSSEDRNLLRWHLVDNASLRRIALVRGVNVSTVSRDYARVRAEIVRQVRLALCDRTGLPAAEVDTVMAAVLSRISISITAVLNAT